LAAVPLIESLALELAWDPAPAAWRIDGAELLIKAGPRTDLFVDPAGTPPTLDAPRLLGPIAGDFQLSARVAVEFGETFDAGALLLYGRERTWAKLCLEYSPEGRPMVVSVVTRGRSDDANAFVVDAGPVWLRVARMGPSAAFHASSDGAGWVFVRHFELDSAWPLAVGFLAQSPLGQGCVATFDEICYSPAKLEDLRGGG
jgi:uncharacterized protein